MKVNRRLEQKLEEVFKMRERILQKFRFIYNDLYEDEQGMFRLSNWEDIWHEKSKVILSENDLSADDKTLNQIFRKHFFSGIRLLEYDNTFYGYDFYRMGDTDYVFTFRNIPYQRIYDMEAENPEDIRLLLLLYGLNTDRILWIYQFKNADEVIDLMNGRGEKDISKKCDEALGEGQIFDTLLLSFYQNGLHNKERFRHWARNTNNLQKLLIDELS